MVSLMSSAFMISQDENLSIREKFTYKGKNLLIVR